MTPVSLSLRHSVSDLVQLIKSDTQIKHCRVNIINGCGDIFMKYKRNLSEIEDKDYVSVRFYSTIDDIHEDLFHEENFMADDWFNLFVFNLNYCRHLCINDDCTHYNQITMMCDQPAYCIEAVCLDESDVTVQERLLEDVRGIDLIMNELSSRFDSKFYASTIVSMLPQQLIHNSFELTTGEECPIKSLRYLDFDFDGEEIITYMYKILRTHSTEFLTKWSGALKRLEDFTKSTSILL